MLPETATFDVSLSSTARKAAETWVTAHVAPNSPSMRRPSGLGVLLSVILVLSQAGSTAGYHYSCENDAHCSYAECRQFCIGERSDECELGESICVSTTHQSEPPCTPQNPYQVDMEIRM